MEDDVDVSGEVVLKDAATVERHVVVQICGRPEILVIDHDYVIVLCEVIRQVRADESRTARDENSCIVHQTNSGSTLR